MWLLSSLQAQNAARRMYGCGTMWIAIVFLAIVGSYALYVWLELKYAVGLHPKAQAWAKALGQFRVYVRAWRRATPSSVWTERSMARCPLRA